MQEILYLKGEPALKSPGSSVLPTYEVVYTSAADTFQKLPHGTRGHRRPRTARIPHPNADLHSTKAPRGHCSTM